MTDEQPCPIQYFPKRCRLVRLRAAAQRVFRLTADLHQVFPSKAFVLRWACRLQVAVQHLVFVLRQASVPHPVDRRQV